MAVAATSVGVVTSSKPTLLHRGFPALSSVKLTQSREAVCYSETMNYTRTYKSNNKELTISH